VYYLFGTRIKYLAGAVEDRNLKESSTSIAIECCQLNVMLCVLMGNPDVWCPRVKIWADYILIWTEINTNIICTHECSNISGTGDPFQRMEHISQETNHMSRFSDPLVLYPLIILCVHD
jgi:hypothetical protein